MDDLPLDRWVAVMFALALLLLFGMDKVREAVMAVVALLQALVRRCARSAGPRPAFGDAETIPQEVRRVAPASTPGERAQTPAQRSGTQCPWRREQVAASNPPCRANPALHDRQHPDRADNPGQHFNNRQRTATNGL